MAHRHATIAQDTRGGAGGLPHAAGHSLLWRSVNITRVERLGRIGVGLAAIVAGVVLLTGAGSFVAVVLEVLLIVAGLDLLITGALGHCPLYQKLGYRPESLRGSR